jgi:hypothetical protein
MSEQDNQVIDSTTTEAQLQDAEIVLEETTDEETVESLRAKLEEANAQLEKEAEARRQLTARAKSAEAKAKPAEVPQQINSTLDETTIEKKILKSQGMSDELLNELVALSKVRGKSLLDTQSDPIFIALKELKEKEEKSAKANLGASRGSGSVKKGKDFNTPDLTPEEHKELWRQSQGR